MTIPTRPSLLARMRNRDDIEAWAQFHELYYPLLYRYARARGLSHADTEDICSTCYESIVRQMQDFRYDPAKGRFKSWLKTLVNRRIADLLRKRREPQAASQTLRQVPDPEATPDELWERQWQHQHLKYCVDQVRGEVSPQTFKIFSQVVLKNMPVQQVCDELGVSQNAVYKARTRVLERVRQHMQQLDADEQ